MDSHAVDAALAELARFPLLDPLYGRRSRRFPMAADGPWLRVTGGPARRQRGRAKATATTVNRRRRRPTVEACRDRRGRPSAR